MDGGHFLIYKHDELVGDGGHYDDFGSPHDVNYHLRSIAHNTMLVLDPSERWPGIRAGRVTGNDGGQAHSWPHHNGAVADAEAWRRDQQLYDIADITAVLDCQSHVYIAADCTRAYAPHKLESFTRQIVYERPDTFVIFDRVVTRQDQFKKTWLLQAMEIPERWQAGLVYSHGGGRLFLQTLLPGDAQVTLCHGDQLYRYGGGEYLPRRDTGPAPACRVEVSPRQPARVDYFLHLLTATEVDRESVAPATMSETDSLVRIHTPKAIVTLNKQQPGGVLDVGGKQIPLGSPAD